MAEGKKRFRWWLLVGAVLLAIFAAALGLIETVGRRGTIVGRYERLLAPSPLQWVADRAYRRGSDVHVTERQVVDILGPHASRQDAVTRLWSGDAFPEIAKDHFGALPEEPQLKGPLPPNPREKFGSGIPEPPANILRWEDGPVEVLVSFKHRTGWLEYKVLRLRSDRFTWWHVRRWAEQAYTAIHGPRR